MARKGRPLNDSMKIKMKNGVVKSILSVTVESHIKDELSAYAYKSGLSLTELVSNIATEFLQREKQKD